MKPNCVLTFFIVLNCRSENYYCTNVSKHKIYNLDSFILVYLTIYNLFCATENLLKKECPGDFHCTSDFLGSRQNSLYLRRFRAHKKGRLQFRNSRTTRILCLFFIHLKKSILTNKCRK